MAVRRGFGWLEFDDEIYLTKKLWEKLFFCEEYMIARGYFRRYKKLLEMIPFCVKL